MEYRSKSPKHGGYISIEEWMVRIYGLKGERLILYAIIHGFSQDGVSCFKGTYKYLCFWTGYTKQHLIKVLDELRTNGLIQREIIPFPNNRARHYVNLWTSFSRLSPEEQAKELALLSNI